MAVLKVKDPVTGEWMPVATVAMMANSYERFFEVSADGVAALKAEYRGPAEVDPEEYPYAVSDLGAGMAGSRYNELQEVLVIPDSIDGTAVVGLRPGIFHTNERIREVTIPAAVQEIPAWCFAQAVRLRRVHGTDRIRKVGSTAFGNTRVEALSFPELVEMAPGAFGAACYLRSVDIGKVAQIPAKAFMQCCKLHTVRADAVWAIGAQAFQLSRSLRSLPLLAGMPEAVPEGEVASIGDYAFYGSRIQFDWAKLEGVALGYRSTPVMDNTVDYWTGAAFTACENTLGTLMSQRDKRWKDLPCGETGKDYVDACAIFAVLHIHSALSGKVYEHPDRFVEELAAIDGAFVTADGWPGVFANAGPAFEALGYKATVYTGQITKNSYEAMLAALARGAYVYAQVSTVQNADAEHAAVLYGVNDGGEVMVLDSDVMYERYRPTGIGDDVYVYRMPFQNLTGPESGFVIVEK